MLDASDTPQDPSAKAAAIEAAGGSYGATRGFIEQDLGAIAALIRRILADGDSNLTARAELTRTIGARADRIRLQAVLDLAQAMVVDAAKHAHSSNHRVSLVDAHQELVKLAGQAPSYNFDTGLLTLEIGTLLVNASAASEPAHG